MKVRVIAPFRDKFKFSKVYNAGDELDVDAERGLSLVARKLAEEVVETPSAETSDEKTAEPETEQTEETEATVEEQKETEDATEETAEATEQTEETAEAEGTTETKKRGRKKAE